METMLEPWERPELLREVPPAPKSAPLSEDIERVAISLTSAKCPVISTANLGPDIDAFDALVVLAETLGAPVVEGQDAFFGNFPKSHDLYLGQSIESLLPEMDMALLVESRAPWYPPSNRPTDARIIAIGENPLKEHMVYQTMHADTYLEGDTATTLKMLVDALEKHDIDKSVIAQRREKWRKAHDELLERISTAEVEAASATTITPPLVMKALRDVAPTNCSVIDETIVHQLGIREHLMWDDPLTFFRAPSGLGQGLGYALGVKLALPERLVAVTIGDGSFMYNPVVPTLALSDEQNLPLLILVFNNSQYAVMKHFHKRFYPDGAAVGDDDYYGVNIKGPHYEEAAAMIGGYSARVNDPAVLPGARARAAAAAHADAGPQPQALQKQVQVLGLLLRPPPLARVAERYARGPHVAPVVDEDAHGHPGRLRRRRQRQREPAALVPFQEVAQFNASVQDSAATIGVIYGVFELDVVAIVIVRPPARPG